MAGTAAGAALRGVGTTAALLVSALVVGVVDRARAGAGAGARAGPLPVAGRAR